MDFTENCCLDPRGRWTREESFNPYMNLLLGTTSWLSLDESPSVKAALLSLKKPCGAGKYCSCFCDNPTASSPQLSLSATTSSHILSLCHTVFSALLYFKRDSAAKSAAVHAVSQACRSHGKMVTLYIWNNEIMMEFQCHSSDNFPVRAIDIAAIWL